ncbi:MAG: hypothetical protein E7001_09055 [Coriobacteriaceae bacterium]|nr:hypothetical protein [Coriobacteriaceae bacterium]
MRELVEDRCRPPRESELAALQKFGGKEQVTLLNGKEVAYGTKVATRPDILREVGGKLEAIEVKNYDLVNNANGRYSELEREVTARVANLPEGSLQRVVLDVTGRGYDDVLIETIKQGIRTKLESVYSNILAPWVGHLSPDTTSCANLYTTSEGELLIEELLSLLQFADSTKQNVVVLG